MYICKKCKEVYDEDELPIYRNIIGIGDFASYVEERIDCCDCCGGDLEEAVECEECGEWFCEDDVELDDSCRYLCKHCYKEWEAQEEAKGDSD